MRRGPQAGKITGRIARNLVAWIREAVGIEVREWVGIRTSLTPQRAEALRMHDARVAISGELESLSPHKERFLYFKFEFF